MEQQKDLQMLTPKQVADMTGFKEETLRKWRYLGKGGPEFKLIGRSVRYPLSAVQDWIENRPTATSTTQARILNQFHTAS